MKSRRLLWFAIAIPALAIFLFGGGITLAVQLENQDSFCASCHTEPETTFYSRSLENPSDLASSHAHTELNVRCIDCHSGEGINGRISSLQQGARDLAVYLSGEFEQPATSHNPVGNEGCTKCHTPDAPDVVSLTNIDSQSHYHLASYLMEWDLRSPQPIGTCVICHTAHDQSTSAEDHFTPPTNQVCEDCHRDLSGWQPSN